MKILIRNLSRDTTESAIRAMFESHGAVQSCTLVVDKKTGLSKGFGYIEMPKQGEAKAAIKTLNGTKVDDSILRVKKAVPKKDQSTQIIPENENSHVSKGASLDGVTLETILKQMVEKYGWEYMAKRTKINCFKDHPSISSSLKFLRKTEWAREKIEALYLGRDISKSGDQRSKLKSNSKPDSRPRSKTESESGTIKKNVWGTPIDEGE